MNLSTTIFCKGSKKHSEEKKPRATGRKTCGLRQNSLRFAAKKLRHVAKIPALWQKQLAICGKKPCAALKNALRFAGAGRLLAFANTCLDFC